MLSISNGGQADAISGGAELEDFRNPSYVGEAET
jgi:hypothetical protein